MHGTAALIGLDWGTTSFRAYRIDARGAVLQLRSSPSGILKVPEGAFEATLEREIGDWLEAEPGRPVIASGMITSRQGWVEVPYCPCPAGSAELAAGLHRYETARGRAMHFVPGLSIVSPDDVPDVMRGEETQIVGAIGDAAGRRLLVLPGTHSKWARAEGGRITWFATFMTGEVFGVLKEHSILGRLMAGDAPDDAAFARGLAYAREGAGGLLRKLFSARTLGLFDRLPAEGIASYLSGLLIGTEIVEAAGSLELPGEVEIMVIGEGALCARYLTAIAAAGLRGRLAVEHASARGQLLIAQAAELIG
jgi:2-dehydro-3-deoxygalactonokinase